MLLFAAGRGALDHARNRGLSYGEILSAAALAISLWIYLLLDGTDLGVGMLCAFQRSPKARHIINLSLLPVWDGNETGWC